jgi:hypothetical protein
MGPQISSNNATILIHSSSACPCFNPIPFSTRSTQSCVERGGVQDGKPVSRGVECKTELLSSMVMWSYSDKAGRPFFMNRVSDIFCSTLWPRTSSTEWRSSTANMMDFICRYAKSQSSLTTGTRIPDEEHSVWNYGWMGKGSRVFYSPHYFGI